MSRFLHFFGVVILLCGCAGKKTSSDHANAIQRGFSRAAALQPMDLDQTYILPVRDGDLEGRNDDYLRRRSPEQIAASGLSSGCGDYMFVFADSLMEEGYDVLLVDGPEVSLSSLMGAFSGHAIAAVRNPGARTWTLTDPTSRTVVSDSWLPEERFFMDRYHAGYIGTVNDYPAATPDELRDYYDKWRQEIPREILNEHVMVLNFVDDPSFRNADGTLFNPRADELRENIAAALEKYNVMPRETVTITLKPGGHEYLGRLEHEPEQGWVCYLDSRSGVSPGFIRYCEGKIRYERNR